MSLLLTVIGSSIPTFGKSPLALLRRGYKAFDAADYDRVLSYLSEDIVYEKPVGAPEAGTLVGKQAVRGWYDQFAEIFDEVRIDANRFEEVGAWIVAEVHIRGRGRLSSLPIDMTFAQAWRFDGAKFDRVKEHTSFEKLVRFCGQDS